MKKNLITLLLLFCAYLPLKAQVYEVPKNVVLAKKEDYAPYESEVVKAVDWLQKTPWTEQGEKGQQANAFILKWLEGSPDVNVEVGEKVGTFFDQNTPLLVTYIGNMAKYIIEHKSAPDDKAAKTFAVKRTVAKYKAEPSHKKDKDLDKLVALEEKGKLDDWIINNFLK